MEYTQRSSIYSIFQKDEYCTRKYHRKHLTPNGRAMINLIEEKKSIEESEADEFALNAILPHADWKRFMTRTRNVVPYKIAPHIKEEADKHNINPQLLFGRYKHDIGIYKIKNFFETKIQ